MPTPHAIVTAVALCRTARLANAPATDADAEALAEIWLEDLDGLTDAALSAALKAHRTDPARGRWMPTSADLLARAAPAADPDAATWDRIVATVARGGDGRYVDPGERVEFRSVRSADGVERVLPVPRALNEISGLEERHLRALASIGGTSAIRRMGEGEEPAEADRTRATMRRRFLDACRQGALVVANGVAAEAGPAVSATPEVRRLAENLFSAKDSLSPEARREREAARQRQIARARAEAEGT